MNFLGTSDNKADIENFWSQLLLGLSEFYTSHKWRLLEYFSYHPLELPATRCNVELDRESLISREKLICKCEVEVVPSVPYLSRQILCSWM